MVKKEAGFNLQVVPKAVRRSPRRVFYQLPVEIVRRIFELAAVRRALGAALCRVSSTVLQWTIPVLYYVVVIRSPRGIDSLAVALNSPSRNESYKASIKNIYFPRDLPPHFLHFPVLQHLAVTPRGLQDHHVLARLNNLTHLTLDVAQHHVHMTRPLFQSITHILFTDPDAVNPKTLLVLQSFPNLTHLACPFWRNRVSWISDTPELIDFCSFLQKLVDLRIVCFLVRPVPINKDPQLSRHIVRKQKQLWIVLMEKRIYGPDVWESWCNGEENVWEATERCLRQGEGYHNCDT
ncbi:hypothetical protein K439DRAFT_1664472 [Ramaria rubella]|nr:hypothetical protein K439DRAFT_1664472 [Ramaria rubella]